MPRTVIRAGSVAENTLEDGDGDTTVTVEKSNDEDRIRFNTSGVERMVIDSTGVAISGSVAIVTSNPTLLFQTDGSSKATVGVNDSDNILIENFSINKHIVFKANDQGVVREGLRIDGAVPEVVVNQSSESLVDFRVESDNNTHMLFVDGENDRVGVGTSSPNAQLHVSNNSTDDLLFLETTDASNVASPVIKLKRNSNTPANSDYLGQIKFQGENNADQNVTYAKITGKIGSVTDGSEQGIIEFANMKNGSSGITARLRHDSFQLLNATSLAVNGNTELEGGVRKSSIRDVNSNTVANDTDYVLRCVQSNTITITLPSKSNNAGQEIIIKDALGNAATHNIIIDGAGSDTIDGLSTFTVNVNFSSARLICDGINGWMVT